MQGERRDEQQKYAPDREEVHRTCAELGGRYRRFMATTGIDDAARGKGSVQFAVEVDGKRVFTSKPTTGSMPAVSIKPIDVAGKQKLTLVVDYGQLGDIQDYADWCNAVLIK